MVGDKTTPSETVTRKPDDDVGTPGSPAVGGGHQTAQQAAITGMGDQGRSDADRQQDFERSSENAGQNPAPIGGSSGGHSDQMSANKNDKKVAQGHYKVEKDQS